MSIKEFFFGKKTRRILVKTITNEKHVVELARLHDEWRNNSSLESKSKFYFKIREHVPEIAGKSIRYEMHGTKVLIYEIV